MRGRSLIFVAIILPAGALAQNSALEDRISMITHDQIDLRAEDRFTGFEGYGGTPVPSRRSGLTARQSTQLSQRRSRPGSHKTSPRTLLSTSPLWPRITRSGDEESPDQVIPNTLAVAIFLP